MFSEDWLEKLDAKDARIAELEAQIVTMRAALQSVRDQCIDCFVACARCGFEETMANLDLVADVEAALAEGK